MPLNKTPMNPKPHGPKLHLSVGETKDFTATEQCTLYFHNAKIFGVNMALMQPDPNGGYLARLTVQQTAQGENTTISVFKGPPLVAKKEKEPTILSDPTDIIVP